MPNGQVFIEQGDWVTAVKKTSFDTKELLGGGTIALGGNTPAGTSAIFEVSKTFQLGQGLYRARCVYASYAVDPNAPDRLGDLKQVVIDLPHQFSVDNGSGGPPGVPD